MNTGNRQGSAMVEVGVLLPVYVLILVGLIYFGNEVLLWQECPQSARFVATNVQTGAPGGGGAATIARTNGPSVTQDYFLYYQGKKDISLDAENGTFTQQQIRDELIKSSWTVAQTFAFDGSSALSQNLTREGSRVYAGDPPAYAFDGDDRLIAEELSDWFTRSSCLLELTHDSNYLRAVGLPEATVTSRAEAVHRQGGGGDEKSRSGAEPGGIQLVEDLVSRFPADETPGGSVPMPHYPDFMPTKDFWTPN